MIAAPDSERGVLGLVEEFLRVFDETTFDGSSTLDAKGVESAMTDVWRQCTSTTQPDLLLIDPKTAEMYRRVSEEAQRFREVFTPVGLRRLFPGLPAVT